MKLIYDGRTRKQSLEVPMVQASLRRRGLALEYITLGWNVVSVVIVVIAAYGAHSVALASLVIVYYGIREAIHALRESLESAEPMAH